MYLVLIAKGNVNHMMIGALGMYAPSFVHAREILGEMGESSIGDSKAAGRAAAARAEVLQFGLVNAGAKRASPQSAPDAVE